MIEKDQNGCEEEKPRRDLMVSVSDETLRNKKVRLFRDKEDKILFYMTKPKDEEKAFAQVLREASYEEDKDNFDMSPITVVKGSRRIIKFRGGYEDKHDSLAENLEADKRYPGKDCIEIDYEKWTNMDTVEAYHNRFAAISYKHDIRYVDRKKTGEKDEDGNDDKEKYRAMRAPTAVVDEVEEGMKEAELERYWHDGVSKGIFWSSSMIGFEIVLTNLHRVFHCGAGMFQLTAVLTPIFLMAVKFL